jgi:hypothetical protein
MTHSKFVALAAALLITISQIILIGHYTNDVHQQVAVVQPAGDVDTI